MNLLEFYQNYNIIIWAFIFFCIFAWLTVSHIRTQKKLNEIIEENRDFFLKRGNENPENDQAPI